MANKTGTDGSAAISAVAGEVPSREEKELIADKHETPAGTFTGRLGRSAWAVMVVPITADQTVLSLFSTAHRGQPSTHS